MYIAGTPVKGTRTGPMVVAAGDDDASRMRRLTAMVKNQGPTCSWRCCCQKCRARNISNESISCSRRSIGTWMAQPNFRQPVRPTRLVYLAQRGEAEDLPTESQLAAVSPVDNSERSRLDYAHSIDMAVSVCLHHTVCYNALLSLSAEATASLGCAQPDIHLVEVNVKGKLCSPSGPGAESTAHTTSSQNACMPGEHVQGRLATAPAQGTDCPEPTCHLFCKGHSASH